MRRDFQIIANRKVKSISVFWGSLGSGLPLLADRAEESRPAADHDPADRGPAAAAGQARPAVRPVVELKAPRRSVIIFIIPDGRPSGADGPAQDRSNGRPEPPGFPGLPVRGLRQRVEPGGVKDLVGIDVPDPRQEPLVEKQALQPAPPALEAGEERNPADLERLRAKRGDLRARGGVGVPVIAEKAELADVPEPQLEGKIPELDEQMRVPVPGRSRIGPQELPRHLQMEKEEAAPLAGKDEELSPPADSEDPDPRKFIQDGGRPGPQQLGQEQADVFYNAAGGLPMESGGDRFDFGQLGHARYYKGWRESLRAKRRHRVRTDVFASPQGEAISCAPRDPFAPPGMTTSVFASDRRERSNRLHPTRSLRLARDDGLATRLLRRPLR